MVQTTLDAKNFSVISYLAALQKGFQRFERRRHVTPHAVTEVSEHPAALADGSQGKLSANASGRSAQPACNHSCEADSDTIAAIVTGPQQAAVAIIRVSGPEAISVAGQVFRHRNKRNFGSWQPVTHRVYYGNAVNRAGQNLDEVLAIAMLAPRSYTAETVVEIHTHGGAVPARRVLSALLEAGARLAGPGEFTLRAFLNGRLDLSQAEAVGQLITARTSAAADAALAGLSGGLAEVVSQARAEIIQVLAEVEARLDFDEDLPPLNSEAVANRIASVATSVRAALDTARQGQLLQHGLRVALIGRPNVGKSSLLNAWSGTQRSIVTDTAGTTRDIVEAGVTVGGIPVTLLDTAGMRDALDAAEAIGVQRSSAAARAADIVIMVVDAQAGWTEEDEKVLQQLRPSSSGTTAPAPPLLLVVNKVDLAAEPGSGCADYRQSEQQPSTVDNSTIPRQLEKLPVNARHPGSPTEHMAAAPVQHGNSQLTLRHWQNSNACKAFIPASVAARVTSTVATSAVTGNGLADLKAAVLAATDSPDVSTGGMQWAVNERQAEALLRALEALDRCARSVSDQLPWDFWTIDLRGAAVALGEVSGHEVNEEVLDSIFSRFCIGK